MRDVCQETCYPHPVLNCFYNQRYTITNIRPNTIKSDSKIVAVCAAPSNNGNAEVYFK